MSAELPREVAKAILSLEFSPTHVARMNELALKSQAGKLLGAEGIEIESFRSVARLLEILKLRARAALDRGDSTNRP